MFYCITLRLEEQGHQGYDWGLKMQESTADGSLPLYGSSIACYAPMAVWCCPLVDIPGHLILSYLFRGATKFRSAAEYHQWCNNSTLFCTRLCTFVFLYRFSGFGEPCVHSTKRTGRGFCSLLLVRQKCHSKALHS